MSTDMTLTPTVMLTPEQEQRYGVLAIQMAETRIELKRLLLVEKRLDYYLEHADQLIAAQFEHEKRKVELQRRVEVSRLRADAAEHDARYAVAVAKKEEAMRSWRPAKPEPPRGTPGGGSPASGNPAPGSPADQLYRLRRKP